MSKTQEVADLATEILKIIQEKKCDHSIDAIIIVLVYILRVNNFEFDYSLNQLKIGLEHYWEKDK